MQTAPTIAFKEWAPIVSRLASGRQSLILRKGGIHEPDGGFAPAHRQFWLFPSLYHPTPDRLKAESAAPTTCPEALEFAASLEDYRILTDWDVVARLHPFHGWSEAEVRKRYEGGDFSGVHALLVRVWRCNPIRPRPEGPEATGCRSWIPVNPAGDSFSAAPVMNAHDFDTYALAVRRAWGPPNE